MADHGLEAVIRLLRSNRGRMTYRLPRCCGRRPGPVNAPEGHLRRRSPCSAAAWVRQARRRAARPPVGSAAASAARIASATFSEGSGERASLGTQSRRGRRRGMSTRRSTRGSSRRRSSMTRSLFALSTERSSSAPGVRFSIRRPSPRRSPTGMRLAPDQASGWVAGLDPAFASDPFGLALVGRREGRLVLGRVQAWTPRKRWFRRG